MTLQLTTTREATSGDANWGGYCSLLATDYCYYILFLLTNCYLLLAINCLLRTIYDLLGASANFYYFCLLIASNQLLHSTYYLLVAKYDALLATITLPNYHLLLTIMY